MAARRKVSNLLALAVLTLAAERPMHPYEMATTLRERGKDQSIKINWGSLYTVVGNLEKHGFLEATEVEREGRRPERTVYRITDAGAAELRDWMRELLGTYTKEYRRFEAALCELPVLPPDETLALLTVREQAIRDTIADRQKQLDEASRAVPRLLLVEVEYELALLRAEAGWLRSLIAELADGTFPGLSQWREFHAKGLTPAEVSGMPERGEPPA